MKGITLRKDGRYMIRQTIYGKRITKYASTLAQAKQILKQFKQGKIKLPRREKESRITLSDYAEIWFEHYKKPFLNERSQRDVKNYVNKIVAELGQRKITNLTTLEIQTYLNNLPKTRTKEKICLYFNAILQKAYDTDIIKRNPFVAVIKDKKMKWKNNAFNYLEQEKILNAIKNTDIEHEIYIYLMCGCRPNELPAKTNFDFTNNIINVYGTKNENAKHRQIEMSNEFANYIKKYFAKNDIKKEEYISSEFIKICKNVGIENPLLYRLRHTFATNHFTIGTQAKRVQQWLGHSSISTTLDTYTDIDKTASKEKIIKLYNNFYYLSD